MTSIRDWLIGIAKEREEDGYTSFLEDVYQQGCSSGVVSELIYYTDTSKFHDEHEEEIWDELYNRAEEMDWSVLHYVNSLNGGEDITSMHQLKNLLVWWAIEGEAWCIVEERKIEEEMACT